MQRSATSPRFDTNESPTKSRPLQRSGETDETGETKTRSSGALLRCTATHETFASKLPRWGSRARIPSSAPKTRRLTRENGQAGGAGVVVRLGGWLRLWLWRGRG